MQFIYSKPLSLIFQNCLNSDMLPYDSGKVNFVPVHKKNSKQLVQLTPHVNGTMAALRGVHLMNGK